MNRPPLPAVLPPAPMGKPSPQIGKMSDRIQSPPSSPAINSRGFHNEAHAPPRYPLPTPPARRHTTVDPPSPAVVGIWPKGAQQQEDNRPLCKDSTGCHIEDSQHWVTFRHTPNQVCPLQIICVFPFI